MMRFQSFQIVWMRYDEIGFDAATAIDLPD
jgi:hypothetical protein